MTNIVLLTSFQISKKLSFKNKNFRATKKKKSYFSTKKLYPPARNYANEQNPLKRHA